MTRKSIKIIIILVVGIILFTTTSLIFKINLGENSQYRWSNSLIDAIESHDMSKVEMLLESNNMDVNVPGGVEFPAYLFPENSRSFPLEIACINGDYNIVKMLIDRGADPNLPEYDYGTPLLVTLMEYNENDYKIVEILLENGAIADKIEGTLGTPLVELASIPPENEDVEEEILELYKLLLQYSKISEPIGEDGYTILTNSTIAHNAKLIQFLIQEQSVSINEQDEYGRTALCYLAYLKLKNDKDVETAKLLLSKGAKKNLKDKNGKYPYDYAIENDKDELAKELKPE